jgi:WhiB family transcriptional regulator, redox-sensing transcriptional regulator
MYPYLTGAVRERSERGQRLPADGGTGARLPAARPGHSLRCTDYPELFFAESPDEMEAAKALCGNCPAQAACLAGALERREPWGVWGGEVFLDGAIVPRKRPRGRPRKTDAAAGETASAATFAEPTAGLGAGITASIKPHRSQTEVVSDTCPGRTSERA